MSTLVVTPTIPTVSASFTSLILLC